MKTILSLLVGIGLALAHLASQADEAAQKPLKLSIDSKNLRDALNDWAQQTGYQLMAEIKDDLVAPSIEGRLTPEQALKRLLEGTSLTYEWMGERLVAVREKKLLAPAALQATESNQPAIRVAKFTEDQASNPSRAGASRERSAGQGGAQLDASATDIRNATRDAGALEGVIVTGTHLKGGAPTSQAISISRSQFEKTGLTTVEALAQTLPQNFSGISADGRFALEGGSSLAIRNSDRSSSIDLRGLGAQSTLTLLDGMRYAGSVGGRVFDVSTVPLSMIERVDVVTGGHSAIYGSDAVAGVVNLIPRREYDGLQTQLSYGGAEGGGERLQFSQLAGVRGERGGFVVGYDYSKESAFDLADVDLLLKQPTPAAFGVLSTHVQVQPDARRHSGFFSGHMDVSDDVALFGSALYTDKKFEELYGSLQEGATSESFERTNHPSTLYGLTAGTRVSLADRWSVGVTGTHSKSDIDSQIDAVTNFATSSSTLAFVQNDKSTVSSLSGVLNGTLFQVGDAGIEVAIGGERREEKYDSTRSTNGTAAPPVDNDRSVTSAFAELLIPLARDGAAPLLHRLEVTLAGRYDDYSDFGDTTNPQAGVLWEPLEKVRLRASYSQAFRAPALAELSPASTGQLRNVLDPRSSTGRTPLLILTGDNPDLTAEEAETWMAGIEFQLTPATTLGVSYFDIDYTDRIEIAALGAGERLSALANETLYPGLVSRTPSRDEAQAIIRAQPRFFNLTGVPFDPLTQNVLDVFPTLAIFDNRSNNIAIESARGLDLLLSGSLPWAGAVLDFGLNGTYFLDHERSVTETSPTFSLMNEVGKPMDLRLRANVGWTKGPVGVTAYINYADGYSNPFSTPRSSIPSVTTVDLAVRLDYTGEAPGGVLAGTVTTLSVQNLFDKAAPRFENGVYGVRYDPVNGDPFGRYLSLSVRKEW